MVWHFDAFNAHDGHEIISWIREIWTFEIYIGEIFHCFVRIVEVFDVTLGEKDEFIKDVENVGVRLMNSLNDSSSLTS